MKSAMELSGSTQAVVGVWQKDGSAYVQGFGDGVSANSQIRAAQAGQPVMCALLLDLVDQGRLKLDRKVSTDLTQQVGIEGITYGQLCAATSGLGDFKRDISAIFANNPLRQWSDRELFAHSLAFSPMSWPGLNVHVNDSNTLLLARGLRSMTGSSISDLLESHVFSKAGMGSSYYPNDVLTPTEISGGMTGLTRQFAGKKAVCDVDAASVPKVSPSMLGGAGATVTTVTDLKNFYEKYLDGSFGGKSAKLITETVSTTNPKRDKNGNPIADEATDAKAAANPRSWGFGVEKIGPLYGMSGSMTGTITAAYRDPQSGSSVVVSLNNSSAGAKFAQALAFELAAIAGVDVAWTADDQVATLEKLAVCQ